MEADAALVTDSGSLLFFTANRSRSFGFCNIDWIRYGLSVRVGKVQPVRKWH